MESLIDEKLLCADCKINIVRRTGKRGPPRIRCDACRAVFRSSYVKYYADKINRQLAADGITDKACCDRCKIIKSITDFINDDNQRLRTCKSCREKCGQRIAAFRKTFCKSFWDMRASRCTVRLRQVANKVTSNLARQESIATTIRAKPFVIEIKGKVLAEIFSEQKGKCFYCCADLKPEYTSVDHATPVSRGGDNHRDNIHIACDGCNRLKGDLNEQEFFEFRQEYIKRPGKQL